MQQHDLEQCADGKSGDSWRAGYAQWVAKLTPLSMCLFINLHSVLPINSKEDTRVAFDGDS